MNLPSIFDRLFRRKEDSRTKMQRLLTGPTAKELYVSDAQSWNPGILKLTQKEEALLI